MGVKYIIVSDSLEMIRSLGQVTANKNRRKSLGIAPYLHRNPLNIQEVIRPKTTGKTQKKLSNNMNTQKIGRSRSKRPSQGTRRSRDPTDATLDKISSTIDILNSKLTEFVTRTELNSKLKQLKTEVETNARQKFAEAEVNNLEAELKILNTKTPKMSRQSSTSSEISNISDLFVKQKTPTQKNRKISK
jgi:hypothetical protein